MSFDFGAELSQPETNIKVWPTEGQRVALVDADLIPYKVGYSIDPIVACRAAYRVEKGECQSLKDTPEFEDALEKMCLIYNDWVQTAGCDAAIPYLTLSENNFRNAIAFSKPYKGQRKSEKPPFFAELKTYFIEQLGGVLADGEEADDLISIEANERNRQLAAQGVELGSKVHQEFCDFVIISSDKDSRITCGWHYDPDKQRKTFGTVLGELEPDWKDGSIKKLKGSGLKFFYAQMIMGDQADNYAGIPRKGPKFVYDLLAELKSEKELYYAVLGAFKGHYGETCIAKNYRGGKRELTAYQMMLEQARLAHMQTFKGDIWRANSHLPSGEEAAEWN